MILKLLMLSLSKFYKKCLHINIKTYKKSSTTYFYIKKNLIKKYLKIELNIFIASKIIIIIYLKSLILDNFLK